MKHASSLVLVLVLLSNHQQRPQRPQTPSTIIVRHLSSVILGFLFFPVSIMSSSNNSTNISPSRRPPKRMDIKSTPSSRQTSASKKQPIDDELPVSYLSVEQDYDGKENTITTSTSIGITTMPSTKGTPFKIARWRDLTTDQKWEF